MPRGLRHERCQNCIHGSQGREWGQEARTNFVVVHLLRHVWLFVTLWTAACQVHLSSTICWSLLKLMSIESIMLSNYLILCHPLLLLPSFFLSIRVFSSKSALCIRWPKSGSFSFSISPSSEYSGLIESSLIHPTSYFTWGTLHKS